MASLPALTEIESLLKTFFRRDLEVSSGTAPASPGLYAGTYVCGDGREVAAVRADLAFAASSAAAFALIPARVAQESISAGQLDEVLSEIYAEVLNVLSRLLANRDSQRVTLKRKDIGDGSLSGVVSDDALHVSVDVDGYACGRLSFYLL